VSDMATGTDAGQCHIPGAELTAVTAPDVRCLIQ
jgi:hypothetical protein